MISIVMTYFNRKSQLTLTLKSIEFSEYKDVEVIIVDDCSDENQKLTQDFLKNFNLNIRVIEMNPKDKWYTNPCIPFNKGLKDAKGDKLIIQNPECIHVGDVISYVNNSLKENEYISFACYSLDKQTTDKVSKLEWNDKSVFNDVINTIQPIRNQAYSDNEGLGWYNHPTLNPQFFHFCSAIYNKHIVEMGGFDERYANGVSYDDNELVYRLRLKGLNMNINIFPMVVHLHHEKVLLKLTDIRERLQKNKLLLHNTTMQEKKWKVN